MNKQVMQQIETILTCFICFKKLNDPHQCSYCSQAACKKCLEEWLQAHNQCPFCRQEIGQDLSSPLIVKSSLLKSIMTIKYDKCLKHDELFEFYCNKCSEVICKICAVLGIHKSHPIITGKQKLFELKAILVQEQEKKKRILDEFDRQFNKIPYLLNKWQTSRTTISRLEKEFIMGAENKDLADISKSQLNDNNNQLISNIDQTNYIISNDSEFSLREKIDFCLESIDQFQLTTQNDSILKQIEKLKELNIDQVNPPSQDLQLMIEFKDEVPRVFNFKIWQNVGTFKLIPIFHQPKKIKVTLTFSLPIQCRLIIKYKIKNRKQGKIYDLVDIGISFTSQLFVYLCQLDNLKPHENEIELIIKVNPLNYFNFCQQMLYYSWQMELKLNQLGYYQFDLIESGSEFGEDGDIIMKKMKASLENGEIIESNKRIAQLVQSKSNIRK